MGMDTMWRPAILATLIGFATGFALTWNHFF